MRTLPFVLLVIVAGCSSPKPGKVVVAPSRVVAVPDYRAERVRYPELVKGYHVARYAEPNRLLMHEAHTVYRVESQTSWNLHSASGCFVLPSGTAPLTNAAFVPPATSDAVVAELNQQRAMTRVVTQQAESLNASLHEFTAALANTRTLAEQNKALREQLSKTERRIEALEAERKKPTGQPRSVESENK